MHELSIVMGILKIAETETKKAGADIVESIELEIGTLSGVEMAALDFAWEEGVKNTVLEKAEKHIAVIPGKAQCMECDSIFELENVYDPCPECNNYLKGIIRGKELRVKALEVS
ncbi:hydrogenase maturation nickel metallochaperone HypA [Lutimonas zeaxanthinifaciens]|uniref:hydrogenase maturation nickel metallochaperone HypA/HybF n=1 Tax=Lutimonas zeaxanthinifaciens TaxID=3060215 RepID=UPI00265D03EC|nr:hydrogenase maturation nickel metallochaperone HypA [Lutimonas sp. YSD2104]WKK65624.1 hydrogenase maturation nickel metallochaperone HypA [Lutimonas sp. YSD2104]